MDQQQKELLQKIYRYGLIAGVSLMILAAIFVQLNKARLNITAPDGYTISVARERSADAATEIGTGNSSYSSSESGPAYIIAESENDTFYSYAYLQNRQTRTIEVTPGAPDSDVDAQRLAAPVSFGHIENNVLYGISEKTRSIAVNELGNATADRFFFGYPAMTHVQWIDRNNFVYDAAGGEAGFSFQGRSGNNENSTNDEYAHIRTNKQGNTILFEDNRIAFLDQLEFVYVPPAHQLVEGIILEANITASGVAVAAQLENNETPLRISMFNLEGVEQHSWDVAAEDVPEGRAIDIEIIGDNTVLVLFTGGIIRAQVGEEPESIGTLVDSKSLLIEDDQAHALLADGLYVIDDNGLSRTSKLIGGTIGSVDSLFESDGDAYFSSRGFEDHYLYRASLSSLE